MERVDYQPLIVQDLLTWYKNDELNLSPWYQRRSVWARPQKAYLINTLLEQKPVPTLYFRHEVDLDADKAIREVVDGQQRIRAILEYVSGEFTTRHPTLGKRVAYKDLSTGEKKKLRETGLSGAWLLGATEQDVIEIFGRLNSVAKTLNPAEKRNAAYGGEFKQFCLREAACRVALWRDLNIFTANEISRMQEVQFIADLSLNFLESLSDFSSTKLDKLYKERDEEFPEEKEIAKRLERCFSRIAELRPETIKDSIFSRQPVFFSLIVVLDTFGTIPSAKKIKSAIEEVDARFNSSVSLNERPKRDAEFYQACTASTQRLSNRRIRHNYLKKFLG